VVVVVCGSWSQVGTQRACAEEGGTLVPCERARAPMESRRPDDDDLHTAVARRWTTGELGGTHEYSDEEDDLAEPADSEPADIAETARRSEIRTADSMRRMATHKTELALERWGSLHSVLFVLVIRHIPPGFSPTVFDCHEQIRDGDGELARARPPRATRLPACFPAGDHAGGRESRAAAQGILPAGSLSPSAPQYPPSISVRMANPLSR
jgi:hypothetical protein